MLLSLALLGGAFGVSALAVEWHQETADLDPIEAALRETNDELANLRAEIEAEPSVVPVEPSPSTPTPVAATPTPTATPVPLVVGASSKYGGGEITVDKISDGRVEFILEGPHRGALATNFKVLDEEGFVCEAGVGAESGVPLAAGEKTHFWIVYTCGDDRKAKTLSAGGLIFAFP
jgi:hypothetical protein